jgi:hypothetical protein
MKICPLLPKSKLTHLSADDDDLWQLDGIRTDRVEHVLKLVDDWDEGLHVGDGGGLARGPVVPPDARLRAIALKTATIRSRDGRNA